MDALYFILVIAACLFMIFLLGIRNEKSEEARRKNRIIKEFGAVPPERLKSGYAGIAGYHNEHKGEYFIDDITYNDLSMGDVFDRINYCESASGEEYLYYLLRNPVTSKEYDFTDLENKVQALLNDEDSRIRLKMLFSKVGKKLKYSIYEYLNLLDKYESSSNAPHFIALILMVVSVVLMGTLNFTVGFLMLICIIAYNIVSYFKIKAKIDPYMSTFAYVCRLISMAQSVSSLNIPIYEKENEELRKYCSNLKGFIKGSWILMSPSRMNGSGNPIDVLMDYVRMITHVDIIRFSQMYDKLKKERQSVDGMITVMGMIDAQISIAYFRKSLKDGYCVPVFEENPDVLFEMREGYHPLIENPVKNSIKSEKGVLISGSNASGKSTFLKTCAINAILAQSIHTCLCEAYKAPRYRIYSSMALKDDIFGGDSYYMVEIKSLKRILDADKEGNSAPVMCFIDEVLRGTNTVERISASAKILEHFAASNVCCFAATHDGELTDVLNKKYDVHHFEGVMEGEDVIFDYKIKNGPATTRNAIKLLKKIGYDDNIVSDAENMAKRFEETGEWAL